MKRILLIIGLLLVSSAALAQTFDLPSFFQPAEEDLSVWYLGNIFGSDLIEGEGISNIKLMSRLFGIFNQVCLVVGIIIIVYTMLAGTLNTANEGKPLGEKWNSVWMPMRISLGIALLVPKGGSGYCLAQYLVMWLTLQGIGAADTVWNTMITYFEEGGAIYSQETFEGSSKTYVTEENINYGYKVQGPASFRLPLGSNKTEKIETFLLQNMVCIDKFNNDPDAVQLNSNRRYSAHAPSDRSNLVLFGDRAQYTAGSVINADTPGAECGYLQIGSNYADLTDEQKVQTRIYSLGFYNLARGLAGISKEIATNGYNPSQHDNPNYYDPFFQDARRGVQLLINYIVGYESVLEDRQRPRSNYEVFRRYGWILAGNYYTILANLKAKEAAFASNFITPESISLPLKYGAPKDAQGDVKLQVYKDASAFYTQGLIDWGWKNIYDIPGFKAPTVSWGSSISPFGGSSKIGIVDIDAILSGVKAGQQSIGKDQRASSATISAIEDYLRYLTGSGSSTRGVAKDPILKAATYGKELTSMALGFMLPLSGMLVALNLSMSWNACQHPWTYIAQSLGNYFQPILFALFVFMYTQGALLGVYIPLIPFITFFMGALGWMMQVVESIAAAPLVAIGLVFPETRDDIWGRAAPAMMLILNLFLRPALMIIGFAAAMIVTWIAVEMLNIGFLTLTASAFRIEDMFGFVAILTAYVAVFVTLVTKTYSLINVVPNKVLHWIGDQSMGVQGAEEAIGAAKQGTELGAGAAAGGASAGGKGDRWAAESAGKGFEEKAGKSIAEVGAKGMMSTKMPEKPDGDKGGGSKSEQKVPGKNMPPK